MKKIIESRIDNISTRDAFCFRVQCDVCGSALDSKAIRFSKASSTPDTAEKQIVYDVLYRQEMESALKRANAELAEHMNYCPVCKRLACNKCFLICEELDMCVDCAKKLNESGTPVHD